MLNFFLFYFLLITVVFESYKISLFSLNQNKSYFVFNKLIIKTPLFLFLFFYFYILNSFFLFNFFYFLFFIFICFLLIIIFLADNINYKYLSYFFIFSSITSATVFKNNILIYILNAEFLSIFTFMILFFNNNIKKIKQISVLYFIVSNIITTSFALLLVLIILNNCGSLNFNVYELFNINNNNFFLNYLLFIYFIFKFGQGPAVIFKFKFYKNTSFFNILFYLAVYIIYIWPLLSFMFYNVLFFINMQVKYITIVIVTLFLLNSFNFFYNIFDFLVFSTWAFIWYQMFFILFLC